MMHSHSGVIRVTYKLQQRLGFLAPLLSFLKRELESGQQQKKNASAEELGNRFFKQCHRRAEKWLAAEELPRLSADFTPRAAYEQVFWAVSLGLIESDSKLPTNLGEAWLALWNGEENNPLMLNTPARRLGSWITLLSADGLPIILSFAAMSLKFETMDVIARRIQDKLNTELSQRSPAKLSLLDPLRTFAETLAVANEGRLRALLMPRIAPLIEFGLAEIDPKLRCFRLLPSGAELQSIIHAWLSSATDEDLTAVHLERAGWLATQNTGISPVDSTTLAKELPRWLDQNRGVWHGLTQEPLWESLLLASASASAEGYYFELLDGLRALETLRELHPGSVEWVPGRQMDERFFRLDANALPALFRASEATEPQIENSMPSNVTAPQLSLSEHPISVVQEVSQQQAHIISDVPAPPLTPAQPLHPDSLTPNWLWLRDILEDHLSLEESRPRGIPLLGGQTALRHLRDRLRGLRDLQPEKQGERFYNRLAYDEHNARGREVYGALLYELKAAFGEEVDSIGRLHRRLEHLKPDKTSAEPLHYVAHRIHTAQQDLLAHCANICDGWKPIIEGALTEKIQAQTNLLIRDALLFGRLNIQEVVPALATHGAEAAIQTLAARLHPRSSRQLRQYQVSLEGSLPLAMKELLDTEERGLRRACLISSRQRKAVDEKLELRAVPTSAMEESAERLPELDSSLHFAGSATVAACDPAAAEQRAEQWLHAELAKRTLAWEDENPCAIGSWEVRCLDVEPIAADSQLTAGEEHRANNSQALATWRSEVDRDLLERIKRTRPNLTLRRSLDYWLRAQRSSDPLVRFTCLYTGIEHLLTRGRPRIHFTHSLARALALPLLRRRADSLVREVHKRLLRSAARMPLEHEEARTALRELVRSICSEEPCSRADFLRTLRSSPSQGMQLAKALTVHAPSLALTFTPWLEAFSPSDGRKSGRQCRKAIKSLVDREYQHILMQFGLCYDLRNRIQHEGEPFQGSRVRLLAEAAEVLRVFLRLLLEALLLGRNSFERQRVLYEVRLLQEPFNDLQEQIQEEDQSIERLQDCFFRALCPS